MAALTRNLRRSHPYVLALLLTGGYGACAGRSVRHYGGEQRGLVGCYALAWTGTSFQHLRPDTLDLGTAARWGGTIAGHHLTSTYGVVGAGGEVTSHWLVKGDSVFIWWSTVLESVSLRGVADSSGFQAQAQYDSDAGGSEREFARGIRINCAP